MDWFVIACVLVGSAALATIGVAIVLGALRLNRVDESQTMPAPPPPMHVPEPAPQRVRLVIPDEFVLVRQGWTDEQLKQLREMRDTYRKVRS